MADPVTEIHAIGLRSKFQELGFVIMDDLLSTATCRSLTERLEAVLRGKYDLGQPPDKAPKLLPPVSSKPGKPSPKPLGGLSKDTLQLINIWKSDSLFRDVVCSAHLGRVVAELGGWSGARVANDQVWAKPAGAGPLTFHRDSAYFDFTPSDVITVWFALDDMHPDLGPLEYVEGSHRWSDARWGSATHFFDRKNRFCLMHDAAGREGIDPESLHLTPVLVRAGGCGIHDGRVWHGSDSNSSNLPRRGLGIHFVPAEASLRSVEGGTLAHKLRAQSDQSSRELSEESFPVTWQAKGQQGEGCESNVCATSWSEPLGPQTAVEIPEDLREDQIDRKSVV